MRLVLGVLALAALLIGRVLLWLWSSYSVTSWRTWGFRLTHDMVSVEQHQLGTRTIMFVLKPREDSGQAVRGCANAFESELLYEDLENNCVAFGSRADAFIQWQNPGLKCERARATQQAYSRAREAVVALNRGDCCAKAGA